MGYKDITAGDKKGKVVAARFIQSPKTQTMGFEVAFEFEEPSTGAFERLNWVGWLSERAIENTMDTLVNVLGFNGNDETNADGTLKDENALNKETEVRLVVEIEQYNEKSYPKIKWVNKLSGSNFGSLAPETLKANLDKLGFKAAFLATKSQQKQDSNVPF